MTANRTFKNREDGSDQVVVLYFLRYSIQMSKIYKVRYYDRHKKKQEVGGNLVESYM